MTVLDGNAIAGILVDAFGVKIPTAIGTCASCGRRSRVAGLNVYLAALGTVARCPHCERVLLVIVQNRGVDAMGFATLERSGPRVVKRLDRPGEFVSDAGVCVR